MNSSFNDVLRTEPLIENINTKRVGPENKEEVISFIKKIDHSKIFPPKHSAYEIMVKELNKAGLPRRSMNCFFCFRHVVYLEVLSQGLLDLVKDGVFFTRVASEMWSSASKEDHDEYKRLSTELRKLQDEFHKDKIYSKNKPAHSVFVNCTEINFHEGSNNTPKKKRNNRASKKQVKKTKANHNQQKIQKNTNIINQNIQEISCSLDSQQLIDINSSFEFLYPYPYILYPQDVNNINNLNVYDQTQTYEYNSYYLGCY
ncbi:hypothetical protein C1645_781493 [Glomus cerebriforme]|uniref:HMG box domain-containing protein n=1 Tax=Glomus cerebriforme TaxID=658196 RepID=A0A397SS05_9GLOM|nr:hypothetical protein C1645_781493 [Glomus cerebriforme]